MIERNWLEKTDKNVINEEIIIKLAANIIWSKARRKRCRFNAVGNDEIIPKISKLKKQRIGGKTVKNSIIKLKTIVLERRRGEEKW